MEGLVSEVPKVANCSSSVLPGNLNLEKHINLKSRNKVVEPGTLEPRKLAVELGNPEAEVSNLDLGHTTNGSCEKVHAHLP